jgi:hypothetical protein
MPIFARRRHFFVKSRQSGCTNISDVAGLGLGEDALMEVWAALAEAAQIAFGGSFMGTATIFVRDMIFVPYIFLRSPSRSQIGEVRGLDPRDPSGCGRKSWLKRQRSPEVHEQLFKRCMEAADPSAAGRIRAERLKNDPVFAAEMAVRIEIGKAIAEAERNGWPPPLFFVPVHFETGQSRAPERKPNAKLKPNWKQRMPNEMQLGNLR